jgi:GDP-L-fucose synthase
MELEAKIYVAGHTGLIGSAVVNCLQTVGFDNLLTRPHNELDLIEQSSVREFFEREQPEYVVLAAGKVGGIAANSRYPADFIYTNLVIQTNVLEAARQSAMKRLIFFGSSCMYPVQASQPMKEQELFDGKLEQTSVAYAVSKIAGMQTCLAFNQQENGRRFIPVIPNSTYGENDNLNPESGHVLSALVRRFDDAKNNGEKSIQLWGSGRPRREFVHSSDVADACLRILKADLSSTELPINIGTGEDISIKALAEVIGEITGFQGSIEWDLLRPDGVARKLLDNQRIRDLGWRPSVDLRGGITRFYRWYRSQGLH